MSVGVYVVARLNMPHMGISRSLGRRLRVLANDATEGPRHVLPAVLPDPSASSEPSQRNAHFLHPLLTCNKHSFYHRRYCHVCNYGYDNLPTTNMNLPHDLRNILSSHNIERVRTAINQDPGLSPLDILSLLLNKDAKLTATAFHKAIERHDTVVLQMLVDHGWDLDSTEFEWPAVQ
jgi:hypothetical protein